MRRCLAIAAVLAATTGGCGPARQGTYPSYDAVVSQYIPAGAYQGEPLDDGIPRPDGSSCDCPQVWYDDHWVYHYEGRWLYWHHGYWYTYPYFYVYYWDGLPYVYHGPHHGIHKTGGAPGDPSAATPHGFQPMRHADTGPSRQGSSRADAPSRDSRSDPSPSRSKDSDPGRRR
ncbi:MAG TPA: hypothetical protein VM285_14450 [Polyangia bacterium]|nr:hypothetical protein [Polyangia bacterium]